MLLDLPARPLLDQRGFRDGPSLGGMAPAIMGTLATWRNAPRQTRYPGPP
jgi:hypothetical protein